MSTSASPARDEARTVGEHLSALARQIAEGAAAADTVAAGLGPVCDLLDDGTQFDVADPLCPLLSRASVLADADGAVALCTVWLAHGVAADAFVPWFGPARRRRVVRGNDPMEYVFVVTVTGGSRCRVIARAHIDAATAPIMEVTFQPWNED